MNDSATGPLLEVPLPPPQVTPFEQDRRAFLRLLPGLLATHQGNYVAVRNEQVVDADADEEALILRAWSKFGYGSVFVGLVTDQPSRPERLPLYRHAR